MKVRRLSPGSSFGSRLPCGFRRKRTDEQAQNIDQRVGAGGLVEGSKCDDEPVGGHEGVGGTQVIGCQAEENATDGPADQEDGTYDADGPIPVDLLEGHGARPRCRLAASHAWPDGGRWMSNGWTTCTGSNHVTLFFTVLMLQATGEKVRCQGERSKADMV